jgi:large subunit ribosomal protein L32
MGQPKHKVSKSKQGHRRGHLIASTLASGTCENCGEMKQAHTVCPQCGHYDKKEVIKKSEL